MYMVCPGIGKPCSAIRFNLNFSHPVQRYDIKFSDRFIILRRISGCNKNPPFRNLMTAKGLILQQCKHSRCQCFRHTVNLINKKNSLFLPGCFHVIIYRCHNLTHGIIRHCHFSVIINPVTDFRKSNGTLSGMMGNCIRYTAQTTFPGCLFYNSSFPNTRRSHKKNRSLPQNRITICPMFILHQICF